MKKRSYTKLVTGSIALKEDKKIFQFSYKEPRYIPWKSINEALIYNYEKNFAFQAWCKTPTMDSDLPSLQLKNPRASNQNLLDLFIFILKLAPCTYRDNYLHFLKKLSYFKVNEYCAVIAFDHVSQNITNILDLDETKPLLASLAKGIIAKYSVDNPDNQYCSFEITQCNEILYIKNYQAFHHYFFSDSSNLPEDVNQLEMVPEHYSEMLIKNGINVNEYDHQINHTTIRPFNPELPSNPSNMGIFSQTDLSSEELLFTNYLDFQNRTTPPPVTTPSSYSTPPTPMPVTSPQPQNDGASQTFESWLNELIYVDASRIEPNAEIDDVRRTNTTKTSISVSTDIGLFNSHLESKDVYDNDDGMIFDNNFGF